MASQKSPSLQHFQFHVFRVALVRPCFWSPEMRLFKVSHNYIQDTSSARFFSLCPKGLICKGLKGLSLLRVRTVPEVIYGFTYTVQHWILFVSYRTNPAAQHVPLTLSLLIFKQCSSWSVVSVVVLFRYFTFPRKTNLPHCPLFSSNKQSGLFLSCQSTSSKHPSAALS